MTLWDHKVDLPDDVQLIRAPNPSAMTYTGTNSYLIGGDTVAVIDPGPALPDHLRALMAAIGGRRVSHILVTHAHLDHSPLARPLAEATGAPICAYGPATAGRSAVMERLAADGLMGGGEGVDRDFVPDLLLRDGDRIDGDGWALTALHTPGHFGNHLCFDAGNLCFSGDHVMGWATSLVSPPDGDLTQFRASLAWLAAIGPRTLLPGHGEPVPDSLVRIEELRRHRQGREDQILAALTLGSATPAALTAAIYADTAPALWPAAERNVIAHLVDLHERNLVTSDPHLSRDARFSRV